MRYSVLKAQIEALESHWYGELPPTVPCDQDDMANGEVQFFSVENHDPASDADLPVVVGVGINYGQGEPKQRGSYPVHHLLAHKPPALVEDYAKGMRAATDATLDAYCFAAQTWVTNNYASGLGLWPSPQGEPRSHHYHLVATNFSPFISWQRWTEHAPIDQASLRSAWPNTQHLDDLFSLLNLHANTLWIGHGKEAVWGDFRRWQKKQGVGRWLLTHNLSSQTINMIRPFWMRP